MATYNYRCGVCGHPTYYRAEMRKGPMSRELLSKMWCDECHVRGQLKRDYRSDHVSIAAVPQSTYVPSLGQNISDQRQVDERLKHLTEDSYNRVGYEPKLRARHPSELMSDPGYQEAREQLDRAGTTTHGDPS